MTTTFAKKVEEAIFAIWANSARIMRPDLVAFVIDTRKNTPNFSNLPAYPANLIRNLDYRVREQVQGYTLSESDIRGIKRDGSIRSASINDESNENKLRAWIVRNLELEISEFALTLDYIDADGTLYPLALPGTERKVRLYRVT